MPTTRRKITRNRVKQSAPDWVAAFRDHQQAPPDGSEGRDSFIGWLFFDEPVPGLPEPDSREAYALINAAGV